MNSSLGLATRESKHSWSSHRHQAPDAGFGCSGSLPGGFLCGFIRGHRPRSRRRRDKRRDIGTT